MSLDAAVAVASHSSARPLPPLLSTDGQGVARPLCAPGVLEAIKLHGVGRGEYVALVFSGDAERLGDVIGSPTWSTARKFALADPRVEAGRDLARMSGGPLGVWPESGVRPTPGVCFVLPDAGHPGVHALRRLGGEEFEDYLILDGLSVERLLEARVARLLERAGGGPVAVLGLGDQGRRVLGVLARLAPGRETLAVDSDPARREAAACAGATVVEAEDARLNGCAVISTPLRRPRAFAAVVERARRAGRAVMDNELGFGESEELRPAEGAEGGEVLVTAAAGRVVSVRGRGLGLRAGAAAVMLNVVRTDLRALGDRRVVHVQSGQRVALGERAFETVDLTINSRTDRLAGMWAGFLDACVGLDGQSNQHDAALGAFAARRMLRGVLGGGLAGVVERVMPSRTRAALGATEFERALGASMTGRTLGAPYLSGVEQTALGVLAAACGSDAPMVEIGSALGGSAVLLAAATGGAGGPPIVCIDPDVETRGAMRATLECAGVMGRVRMIERTSDEARDEAGEIVAAAGTGGAGVVFIDGLHTLEQSARDAAGYAELVRPGGVLLMHDLDARFAGVVRTVLEGPARDGRFEAVCIADTLAVFRRVAC